jgi:hypothetical protein
MNLQKCKFDGLDAIEILTPEARMVIITGMGPRIAYWGKPNQANLLYWQNDDLGRENWKLLGGHRVWVTRPGADEAEDAYAEDNTPCEIIETGQSIKVIGGVHPVYKIQRGIEVQVKDDNTFKVTSFLKNMGPMLYSGGVWAPTCIDPSGGKEFGILLGDRKLSWDLVKIVIPRTFAGHTSRIKDDQITFSEDFMIVKPVGIESKRMVMAPHGIIAMSWPGHGISFIKKSAFNPNGNYPLGCNLAIYIGPNNFMVEMETYGEEQTVLPGGTIYNYETWRLVNETFDWLDPEPILWFIE